jgi:hypothetical protein
MQIKTIETLFLGVFFLDIKTMCFSLSVHLLPVEGRLPRFLVREARPLPPQQGLQGRPGVLQARRQEEHQQGTLSG